MRRFLLWLPLAVLALISLTAAQRGALTVQRDLREMTGAADLIIRGRVLGTQAEPLPGYENIRTVVITLRVEETLKGDAGGETFSFRQAVWDRRDAAGGLGYRKGQEVLLLLRYPNQYGVTSPVGLEQGRFGITRDPQGGVTASNGRGNFGLLPADDALPSVARSKLSAPTVRMIRERRAGPLPVSDLKLLIDSYVQEAN